MRPRAIVYGLVLVIVAAGASVSCFKSEPDTAKTPAPTPSEDKFIEEARALAEETPKTDAVGALPPLQGDQTDLPVAELDPPKVLDLGVIPSEGMSKGQIKILSKGKVDLEVTQVKSSCGCAKGVLDDNKKVVPPGDFATVTVTVDPRRISGFEARRSVTIFTTDPENPKTTVAILAKIDPEFEVEPNPVDFGEVKKGTPVTKTVLFRQLKDEPVEITGLQPYSHGDAVEVSFEKRPESEWKSPNRAEYIITVGLSEYASPGNFVGRFAIQTNCKRLKSYLCNVKGKIVSFYTLAPKGILTLRNIPGQTAKQPMATASISADRPFEILDLKASTEDIEVSTRPGTAPNSAFIDVALKPDIKPGHRNENVTFTIKAGEDLLNERLQARILSVRPRPPKPAASR